MSPYFTELILISRGHIQAIDRPKTSQLASLTTHTNASLPYVLQ